MKNGDKGGLGNGIQEVVSSILSSSTRNIAGLQVTADPFFIFSILKLCHLCAWFLDDGEYGLPYVAKQKMQRPISHSRVYFIFAYIRVPSEKTL